MTKHLVEALKSVNWSANVEGFVLEQAICIELDAGCRRIAIWSKQLENIDGGNPAISFVRALQIAAHQSVATMSLGIYKAAATSIRGLVENALYYTFFRNHPVELASLVRNRDYYVTKSEILAFHKSHTPGFKVVQDKVGLIGRIEEWYSRVSAIVHGQILGAWVDQKSLGDIKINKVTLQLAAAEFCEAERIVHFLFLATVGREFWDGFSPPAKKTLLSGVAADIREVFGLDKQ